MAFFMLAVALRKRANSALNNSRGFAVGRPEQLKLAVEEAEILRRRRARRRAFMLELDDELAAAMARIEKLLNGQDVHKWIAEELTDDEQHPVSVTQVHDWLARRNGRRPPGELIAVVCEADETFNAWWERSGGYEAPKKITRLSWEDERKQYREALLEFGSAGEVKLRRIATALPALQTVKP